MNLTKIIWTALTGSVTLVVFLLGSWMGDVNHHTEQTDIRLTTTEQHYAAIQQDLQDLREDLRDLKKEMEAENIRGKGK